MRRLLPLLLIALSGAACETATGPSYPNTTTDTATASTPTLTPIDPTYVRLVPADTSVWAVKGQALDVKLRFQTGSGSTSDQFAEFQLAAGSLSKRPDGTAIAVGDSVLITIHPDTTGRMAATFEPSGLVFDSSAPALLTMWCYHAAADLNGDGVVNQQDEQLWYQMAIWKREKGQPWVKQSTTRSSDGYTLQTLVSGFTGFSVAS